VALGSADEEARIAMNEVIRTGRRVAVIDIGTNTLLLLVAEVQASGQLHLLHDACRFGRLGQGLDRSGVLADEAVRRSLDILREYRTIIDGLAVEAVAAVGTQALREARNSDAFTIPAAEILGVPIEIIAGQREAELVYRAVVASWPELSSTTFIVADVGGGSTEVIVASPDGVASFDSVPIGSVRLAERHLHGDPPTPAEVQALFADIDRSFDNLALPPALPADLCVVGTAGTATTMASVALTMPAYDRARVHGYTMSVEAVMEQLSRLLSLTLEQRRALPGLEPQRADVIAAGVAIFARLLQRVHGRELLICDCGVRWGMAYALAAR
jgi:exopolyphosphatase/guanosine-5'-triphosphate,3'-diphosphate pyrophosphatase